MHSSFEKIVNTKPERKAYSKHRQNGHKTARKVRREAKRNGGVL